MIDKGGLNKSIYDAGWASFVQILLFKAGKEVIMIDPKNTSQMCSGCGKIPEVKKTLQDRIHKCDCGTKLDRDHNAARNILDKGNYKVWKRPLASAEESSKHADLRILLL